MMYIWLGIMLVVLALLWILFFVAVPGNVVQLTILVGIVLSLASSVLNFFKLYTIPSGIAMIVGVIGKIIWYVASKSKISVGSAIVTIALKPIRARPSTIFAVLFGFVLQMLCGLGLLGSIVRWKASDPRTYISIIIAYWVFDGVRFLTYTTVSGIVGHWYFFDVDKNGHPLNQDAKSEENGAEGSNPCLTPSKTPVMDAFVRALTKSAGSISLGALLLSIMKIAQFYKESVDNAKCPAVKKALLCCVKCCKTVLNRFQDYAFVFVAVYGSGFCDSASESRKLVRGLSLDEAMKHKMVEDVRNVGVLVVSLCSWAATFGLSTFGYKVPYQVALPQSVLAMWVAGCVMTIPMVLLEAPLATIVLLFGADDGAALQATKPDVFASLDRAYRVLWRMKYIRKDLASRARGCCSTGGKGPTEEEVAKEVDEEDKKLSEKLADGVDAAKAKAADGVNRAKISVRGHLEAIKASYNKTLEDVKESVKSVTKTDKGDDAIEMTKTGKDDDPVEES